jgi:hypothetical protein
MVLLAAVLGVEYVLRVSIRDGHERVLMGINSVWTLGTEFHVDTKRDQRIFINQSLK